MQGTGEVVEGRELAVLANLFAEGFTLSYPVYGTDLLSARPAGDGYAITVLCRYEDFFDGAERFGEHAQEMPLFTDFEECLLASGITAYENLDEFATRADLYRGLRKDVYYGVDTNLLYHRFVTVTGALQPEETILVDVVRQEIEYVLNHKYSARLISELIASAPEKEWIIAEFENRRKKKSRKAAYRAMAEYRALRDRAILLESGQKATHATRENDQFIVRALRRFEEERFNLPVLLTADAAMADLCDAGGLEYFLFRAPYHARPRTVSPQALLGFIADLAVTFGVVEIEGTCIFSEYGGKGNNADAFKLTFIDEHLHTEFALDVDVCRHLLALGIER
ncbi:PIN domain-containing protein [Methanofollis sp. UBA420]|jgi:hypothetical protein|uniref:PIN domain-containing protein n=1 Tax=Methanofollis sp. UBA420 TaxID=1915514 RepID=UPI00316AE6DB